MQLEIEHRRTARARAHARAQLANEIEQLRVEIATERKAMQQKIEALRAELEAARHAVELWCEWRERCKRVYEELELLREWKAAHIEHQKARRELHRRRLLEAAWAAERDPALPLQ